MNTKERVAEFLASSTEGSVESVLEAVINVLTSETLGELDRADEKLKMVALETGLVNVKEFGSYM